MGADFCFFYHVLGKKTPNLGSHLHRANSYEIFRLLKAFSCRSERLFAYAFGFLTHYAADATFHPYVYSQAGNSYAKHTRLENALDSYFKNFLSSERQKIFYQKPSNEEETELYILYAAIAKKTGFPPLEKTAFSRAISLFNAYPPIPNALPQRKSSPYLRYACNMEKRAWHPPSKPFVIRNDNAEELFQKTLAFAQEISVIFYHAVRENAPLPFPLFHKHFLKGEY